MDNWPVSLQQKLNVAGFQLRLGNTRIASDMDTGPAKVRSRFTDAVDGYECEVLLDYADIATFKTFYKTNLGNGTLPFLFTDPTSGIEEVFRFTPGQDPIIRPLGGRMFSLSMSWERMP